MNAMKTILAVLVLLVGHAMSNAASPPVVLLTVDPGADLAQVVRDLPPANVHLFLKAGEYKVTPSMVRSNGLGALNIFNRSNLTIEGVPGLTRINGRSAVGELFWITNCENVALRNLVLEGRVVTNIVEMDGLDEVFSGVGVYDVRRFTMEGCAMIDHHDHGILDYGSQINWDVISTNNVTVRNNWFHNIGSTWTNGPVSRDGTAVVPTGWVVENNTFTECLRGVEPYSHNDDTPNRFYNCIIRNNRFYNTLEFGVGPAGSTNGHSVVVEGNDFINDYEFTRRGTNILQSASAIWWNGGYGWKIRNNNVRGRWAFGIYAQSGVRSGVIMNNTVEGLTNYAGIASVPYQFETAYNLLIANNSARNSRSQGMYLYGLRDSEVRGNLIESPFSGAGIQLATFSSNVASNLLVRGNVVRSAPVGILDQLGSLEKITLLDNELQGVTTNIHNLSGDALQVAGPWKTFNFTNDFPSLASGGSFRTNFPASGVRTNDYAAVMVPDQFYRVGTNIVVNSWASNDVVWLYLHNAGPAAADVGSVRFKVQVRQLEAY